MADSDRCRLDKWLWAARFFKTRGLATESVAGGKVHVENQRVKPSHATKVGQEIQISHGGVERTVIVQALSVKRGPATEAQKLYSETPESVVKREQQVAMRKATRMGFDAGGKPSKKDRRRLRDLRQK